MRRQLIANGVVTAMKKLLRGMLDKLTNPLMNFQLAHDFLRQCRAQEMPCQAQGK